MSKKRKNLSLEEALAKQVCYYCERDFEEITHLVEHQKAMHFRCVECHRRLNTAGGLATHLKQVHKRELPTIPNALPHRQDTNIEIFGMIGIPQDVLDGWYQDITTEFQRHEAQHRALTGNPLRGSKEALELAERGKKRKADEEEEKETIKQRVAALRAKKKAEKEAAAAAANGERSGSNTPAMKTEPVEAPAQVRSALLTNMSVQLD